MSDESAQAQDPLDDEVEPSPAEVALDRIGAFRVTYVAIMVFLLAYLFSIQVFEEYLNLHFEQVVSEAIDVGVSRRPPGQNIRLNLMSKVDNSSWVKFWRVKVDVVVVAKDGETWLYVDGRAQIPRYSNRDPEHRMLIHRNLLPASATVTTSIEHNTMLSNSLLIGFASILLISLYGYNKRVVDQENKVLDEAHTIRDEASNRANQIQLEIESVRAQLQQVEPANVEHRAEIDRLQEEQTDLQRKLNDLAAREAKLRGQAGRASALEEEGQALEELLEEATGDLGTKNDEIRELERNLKRVSKIAGISGERSKEADVIARRMRVLYPKLDVDDRAVSDIVALKDEVTKLRAEETIKRLNDDAGNVGVRRKVGGLPNHLSVYELGFAGKRRVYYAKVQNSRFRVLVVGAKNTQQNDLDYISRIPKGEIST